jgi:hypothetical protein
MEFSQPAKQRNAYNVRVIYLSNCFYEIYSLFMLESSDWTFQIEPETSLSHTWFCRWFLFLDGWSGEVGNEITPIFPRFAVLPVSDIELIYHIMNQRIHFWGQKCPLAGIDESPQIGWNSNAKDGLLEESESLCFFFRYSIINSTSLQIMR